MCLCKICGTDFQEYEVDDELEDELCYLCYIDSESQAAMDGLMGD